MYLRECGVVFNQREKLVVVVMIGGARQERVVESRKRIVGKGIRKWVVLSSGSEGVD